MRSGDKFTVDDTVMRGTSSITQPVRWLMNASHQGGKGGRPCQVTPKSRAERNGQVRCARGGQDGDVADKDTWRPLVATSGLLGVAAALEAGTSPVQS